MRWGLFLFVCICHAQTTIKVRDEAGRPVENAQLQFSGSKLFEERTDATGTIVISPKDPFAVVRKPGFLSSRVSLTGPAMTVAVQRAEREWRECSPSVKCDFGTFCFPLSKDIIVRGHGRDVDYTQRFYARKSLLPPRDVISHGSGPNWSNGLPYLDKVEASSSFREESFAVNEPLWAVDSRGTLSDGTLWRRIGIYGETVDYETKNKAAAEAFDKFLDTMCLSPGTVK